MPFQRCEPTSHTQGTCKEATLRLQDGVERWRYSAFHHVGHVNPPSCGPNSCFSIRRILDLPEESVDERSYCSSNSPLGESCTVCVPAVLPRKVLPMVSHHGDNVSCRGLINWQQFPLAAYSHWSYGTFSLNNQGFPLGK